MHRPIQCISSLLDSRNSHGVELICPEWVEADTHTASLGVDAERRLEQVVEAFGYIDIKAWIGILQNNLCQ